ncbi:hypothetical protein J2739_002459 [Variovorax soli]|uniref:High-potential iron-sulfur protein n=2 Tax=Variovorax soli TaxID=376815 RepID=A0ABU1NFQ1_9BURK|nr:hypothetical protein [Variovorax soli]
MTAVQRRSAILRIASMATLPLICSRAAQAAGPKVDEADPVAKSLGYKDDTHTVDDKKFPKHATTQTCSNCQLFQGGPKDALGGCALFAGKQVAGTGWCSAWTKKTG